ncbi:hypothetical protein B0F90DRAFT_1747070, partial [Multifurca ochricompacta]
MAAVATPSSFVPHQNSFAASADQHHYYRERPPVPVRAPSPKHRRGGPSHSRTPSTSSEASSSSWRSHSRSPAVTTVELRPVPQQSTESKISGPLVYSAAELLRLSASPLVGISAGSQTIVNDLVAHHVWRRGPHSSSR